MKKRTLITTAFLTATAGVVSWELIAAFDSSPDTLPWTQVLTDYVPWPITALATFTLVVWLPIHFFLAYRARRSRLVAEQTAAEQTKAAVLNNAPQLTMDNAMARFTADKPTMNQFDPRLIEPEPEILDLPGLDPRLPGGER